MIEKNSGKIFRLPLDYDLGYAYCQTLDYTDIDPFNGRIAMVYDLIDKEKRENVDFNKLTQRPTIVGAHPMIKFPNSRGKDAWKLLGKVKLKIIPLIQFKYHLRATMEKDWTKLTCWRITGIGFESSNECVNYEKIRHLEIPVLYGKDSLIIRTTMYYLIKNNQKVSNFYNLKEFFERTIFIETVNTNFNKKTAIKLLKELDD